MTDHINAAAEAAVPNSLREDLEEAWDRLSSEAGEPESEVEDAPVEDEDETAVPEDGIDPGDEATDDAIAPLAHWPAEWRERFEALPEEARPYALDLHRRFEKAHSDRSQALAEREKELDGLHAVDAALAPWRETMRARGLTDAEAVKRLMEARAELERDPGAALSAIAESYGVAPPTGAAPSPPARRDALVDTLERYASEQHELRLIAAMEAELDARARAVDAAGEKRFPHFETVRPKLAALMRAGAAGGFEDAYEQAVWADPALRRKALEARDAEMAARRESARKAEVAKARNAGRAALSGSEPARSALPTARSHREELERVWDRMVGA